MRLIINPHDKKSTISKNIYGHFSEHLGRCIYGGYFVGKDSGIPNTDGIRNDVTEALRNIHAPVIRWPGGCFADTYNWKDGIGSDRKMIVNSHWGGVVEDNSFGTHEFMRLCELIGCEPYINGNMGSGSVREMAEWVDYITSADQCPMADLRRANGHEEPWKLKYFAIGNENWGCGGNMRPEFYGDLFRQYGTYLRGMYKIACGANADDYDWTAKVMEIAGEHMDALSLHYYTWTNGPHHKGSSTDFNTEEYYRTIAKALRIDMLITKHLEIMSYYDPAHKVDMIVDEWGIWHTTEPGTNPGFLYQQSTMRDAIAAAVTLDIFNAHSDRITMANLAQTINVLQSVILTEGEKMLLTPTYHVFDLYKHHHDATLLGHWLERGEAGRYGEETVPMLSATASAKDGLITLTITNTSATETAQIEGTVIDGDFAKAEGRLLLGTIDAKNDFERVDAVMLTPFTAEILDGGIRFALPACSVLELRLSK